MNNCVQRFLASRTKRALCLLAALVAGCAMAQTPPAAIDGLPQLSGTYTLYRADDAKHAPVGQLVMKFRRDRGFSIVSDWSPQGLLWQAQGRLDGTSGNCDWRDQNGQAGHTTFRINAHGHWQGQVQASGVAKRYVALPQGFAHRSHPPFPSVQAFLSVRHVRRSFPEEGEPPMAPAARDFIGAIKVPAKGIYLMDILDQAVGNGEDDAKLTKFMPGIYRVESIRDKSYSHRNYSVQFSCMYVPGVEPVRWELGQAHGGGKHGLTIIQAAAHAKWQKLVDEEAARASGKDKNATSADYPVWNATTELVNGSCDESWDKLGFRFNKASSSEGVFIPAPPTVDFYFGFDSSGRRVALMCRWH